MNDVMGRNDRSQELEEFIRRSGVVRSRDITRLGHERKTLTRLVRQGRIQRLARGTYVAAQHGVTEWHDLAELSTTAPQAVIALISALALHELGTQLPHQVWIVLPKGARKPTTRLPLRITRFAEPYYSAGVEERVIEGATVRVYSAAKTVADCFKMRSKVGYDVAVEALKEGWRSRKFTMDELQEFAKLNRVDRVMRPYIEAITA